MGGPRQEGLGRDEGANETEKKVAVPLRSSRSTVSRPTKRLMKKIRPVRRMPRCAPIFFAAQVVSHVVRSQPGARNQCDGPDPRQNQRVGKAETCRRMGASELLELLLGAAPQAVVRNKEGCRKLAPRGFGGQNNVEGDPGTSAGTTLSLEPCPEPS